MTAMIAVYGPPLAPPVELSRWLLDSRGIGFDFRPLAAGLSAFKSRALKLPVELPIIMTAAGPIGALRPAFAFVAGADAGPSPPPFDAALVAGIFDGLFSQGVRTFYFYMLDAPAVLKPLATRGVPFWHRIFIRLFFGWWRGLMRKGLKLDAYAPVPVRAEIEAMFDRVAALLPPGQPFLAGDVPGVADRVFAVMASPVLLPDGHPVALPAPQELPAPLRELLLALRAHPAGQLAQRVYATRAAGTPA